MGNLICYLFICILCTGIKNTQASRRYKSKKGFICKLCPAGTYLEASCSFNGGDSNCRPCPDKTFSNVPNNTTFCQHCSRCQITQIELRECSPSSDTVCGCREGQIWVQRVQEQGICKDETYESDNGLHCQLCPIGEYLVSTCKTDEGKSFCKTCRNTTFISYRNNKTACHDCKICRLTQIITKPCTNATDTECQCPDGKYWFSYGGGEGICKLHTVCREDQTVVQQGTPCFDTKCKPFSNKTISKGNTMFEISSETTPPRALDVDNGITSYVGLGIALSFLILFIISLIIFCMVYTRRLGYNLRNVFNNIRLAIRPKKNTTTVATKPAYLMYDKVNVDS